MLVHAVSFHGRTPLHCAAAWGCNSCVEALLLAGHSAGQCEARTWPAGHGRSLNWQHRTPPVGLTAYDIAEHLRTKEHPVTQTLKQSKDHGVEWIIEDKLAKGKINKRKAALARAKSQHALVHRLQGLQGLQGPSFSGSPGSPGKFVSAFPQMPNKAFQGVQSGSARGLSSPRTFNLAAGQQKHTEDPRTTSTPLPSGLSESPVLS